MLPLTLPGEPTVRKVGFLRRAGGVGGGGGGSLERSGSALCDYLGERVEKGESSMSRVSIDWP